MKQDWLTGHFERLHKVHEVLERLSNGDVRCASWRACLSLFRKMYILTTLEFPKHNLHYHLLTTSINATYYCQ